MPLEDTTIRNAKPRERAYKLSDAKGLFLLINPPGPKSPSGSKLWRFKYSFAGKERLLALGSYPEISLKAARERRDEARKLVADGRDPNQERRGEKRRRKLESENAFETVARAFVATRAKRWSQGHTDYVLGRLSADIFPALGSRPIAQIEPPELLAELRKVELRGAHEMASRLRSFCSQIFRFAIASGICTRDAAADLRGALVPHTPSNMASIPIEELPELLARIDVAEAAPYCRNRLTRIGLQLLALTFVRPGELRKATWDQIDFDQACWTLPAGVMKRRRPHLVPLAPQALTLLQDLKGLTDYGELLFPGEGPKGLMSENTLTYALHALGYHGRHTAHGFRALASTVLYESGHFPEDWIELQLAHVEEKDAKRAYNHAKWLDQRRAMMIWLADYHDATRVQGYIKPHLFPPERSARAA